MADWIQYPDLLIISFFNKYISARQHAAQKHPRSNRETEFSQPQSQEIRCDSRNKTPEPRVKSVVVRPNHFYHLLMVCSYAVIHDTSVINLKNNIAHSSMTLVEYLRRLGIKVNEFKTEVVIFHDNALYFSTYISVFK